MYFSNRREQKRYKEEWLINRIILIGRLVRDPELSYTQSGKAVCKFTLAVDRPYAKEGEQSADFFGIVVWNKAGENCAKYLGKGRQCAVEGRLQVRSYEDNNGNKRWVTEVIADKVEFLGGGNNKKKDEEDFGVEVDFDPEDVPF